MLHTSFKQVGTVATKDWYGCGIVKTPVWNTRRVNRFSGTDHCAAIGY